MADKYVNETGLNYLITRLKTFFAKQTDLTALSTRVDDIVAEGGEPNTINTVKVNGTALTPDAQKAVDVQVALTSADIRVYDENERGAANIHGLAGEIELNIEPNNVSISLMDDNENSTQYNVYTTTKINNDFATKTYVDSNGGKIDKIKVNGTEQTITNKEVDITTPTVVYNAVGGYDDVNIYGDAVNSQNHLNVRYKQDDEYVSIFAGGLQGDGDGIRLAPMSSVPTSVSDLTNDSGYQTSSDVSTAITNAIAGITQFDFSVVTELPASGTKGVIYLVSNSGSGNNIYDEYIWVTNGGTSAFEKIGTTEVDLSGYWNETNLTAITTAEIDAIIDGE